MSLLIERAWIPAAAAITTAWRDVARGAGILGRGAVGLVGLSTLAAALLLLGSEQMRDRVIAGTLSATGFVIAGSSSADEDVRAEGEAHVPQRWSDWLAAQPAGSAEPAQEHVTRYLSRRY